MRSRLGALFRLTYEARKQGVKMQHRLLLYWASMALAVFGILLVILSIAGVFSVQETQLSQALMLQQEHTVSALNRHIDTLMAQGILLSENTTDSLDALLHVSPMDALNDNPELLDKVEKDLYTELNTVLRSSACSGVYLVLDATTNTAAEGAEHSRAGLYLRFANLSTQNPVDQDVTLYRGIPAVARENHLELHNRWKMEFDTQRISGYAELIARTCDTLEESCFWTEREQLSDTWESMTLLVVPIMGNDGEVRGICGVEMSDLYLQLCYPANKSDFGSMITVIAPLRDNALVLAEGMTGGLEGSYLDDSETLYVENGSAFHTYTGSTGTYLGTHTRLEMPLQDGSSMYAATLVSQDYYNAILRAERMKWLIGSLSFFLATLLVSIVMARKFVQPIAKSLDNIQDPQSLARTGISEIDTLISFLQSSAQEAGPLRNPLPDGIQELLDAFALRCAQLTPTERNILQYYAQGYDVAQVAELAYISIHTVRRHNANIYQKLDIGARDELMLYIELFRRCERLDELL